MEICDPHMLLFVHFLLSLRNSEIVQKLIDYSCGCFWIILLYRMSNSIYNWQFELPLHLSNHQLFVHSFFFSSEQYFWDFNIEENLRESFKPIIPKLLGFVKIYFPCKFIFALVLNWFQLRWNGNSCRFHNSQSPSLDTPFNCFLLWVEELRFLIQDLVHKRKSLNSCAFNNIYYNHANNSRLLSLIG